MSEAVTLSPELTHSLAVLSRACLTAERNWRLYPRSHPAVRASFERLHKTLAETIPAFPFAIGVAGDTLMVDGAAPAGADPAITELATLLHEHDILHLTFVLAPPPAALESLLELLKNDPEQVRASGGPAKVWVSTRHKSISIQQIDYEKLLADREVLKPVGRRDQLWRSIVQSLDSSSGVLDAAAQKRLLEIAGDAAEITALAREVTASRVTAGGAPMITAQAAIVLATFRQILSVVGVLTPDRRQEVLANLAEASSDLDTGVALRLFTGECEGEDAGIVAGVLAAFDDTSTARLLAGALSRDRQASSRLAEVLHTIAPDSARKKRVLGFTRALLAETDFGGDAGFGSLWSSVEELMLRYEEKEFVSEDYRESLDQAPARAEAMADRERPVELGGWLDSVNEDSVRRLSVILLVDLLKLERHPGSAETLANDMVEVAEDLLAAGDFHNAAALARALATSAAARTPAQDAGRAALDRLVRSDATKGLLSLMADLDETQLLALREFCDAAGPLCTTFLRTALYDEGYTPARRRATEIIVGYGEQAIQYLTPLVGDERWFVQRNAVELLGHIGGRDNVRLLQPLLRRGDPRILPQVVATLLSADDPGAARTLQAAMRGAGGGYRDALLRALVSQQDARIVPYLAQTLSDVDALGQDHALAIEAVTALGRLGDDRAVPTLAALLAQRRWFAWRKTAALRRAALAALLKIGSAAAQAALQSASERGDRALRRLVRHAARV
ncbi:MAG: HEAT repeat domain-containing protein [Acidobacteria bacterium]|nr:HEAT repeat domain-containing protein [Acidobacteriota bacterium]